MMASVVSCPLAMSASTRRLKSARASATAVFRAIIALAQLASEPTARNSKRLPVKAKGEVRLRSVLSMSRLGNLGYVELHALLAGHVEQVVLVALLDVVEKFAELLAQERRDDGRGSLVGAQSVGVGGAHYRGLEQSVVLVNAHEGLHHEGHEAQVLLRVLAGSVEQHASVRTKAPVVVLARAVDAGERLLVQKDAEAVLARHFLHQGHEKHVVVVGDVGLLEDGSYLKLVGGRPRCGASCKVSTGSRACISRSFMNACTRSGMVPK